MPTDVLLARARRRAAESTADADERFAVLVLPPLMALLTIVLAAQSHAVACAVIGMGLQ